jgi:hypothetical protein
VVPDFERVHRELGRPNVTLLLLWNEYADRCRASGGVPYQYSFFNEQDRRWVKGTSINCVGLLVCGGRGLGWCVAAGVVVGDGPGIGRRVVCVSPCRGHVGGSGWLGAC